VNVQIVMEQGNFTHAVIHAMGADWLMMPPTNALNAKMSPVVHVPAQGKNDGS